MKYDAFISYRREGGFLMAQILYDKLTQKGINCFLDLEELNSGKFDSAITDAINSSPNFILILSRDSLNRCVNESDWLRREIFEAIKQKKNIVPVMLNDFEWPTDIKDDIPEEIQSLEFINSVPISNEYLSAVIDKLITYLRDINTRPRNVGIIKLATSSLTVIDSIMQGWEAEKVFEKYGCVLETKHYKWSDKILTDLSDGKIDFAIYNKQSTINYTKNDNSIVIINDVCSSMGGRNFYILALKDSKWEKMTLEQFKFSIGKDSTFAVSKSSDMYKNPLYILDATEKELNERGIRIVDYHSEQGLGVFDFIPDLLLIAGQDIRFLAEQDGRFFEIISYDDFPTEKKDFFYNNSINSFITSKNTLSKMNEETIKIISNELISNFYKNSLDQKQRNTIIKKLSNNLQTLCDDEEVLKYIIDKILFETYRLLPQEGCD